MTEKLVLKFGELLGLINERPSAPALGYRGEMIFMEAVLATGNCKEEGDVFENACESVQLGKETEWAMVNPAYLSIL